MNYLLDTEQLAKRFGVAVSTVKRWKKDKKIPFIQPAGRGGKVRYDYLAVLDALTKKKVKRKKRSKPQE